jgi:hypothetical protein
VVAETLTGSQLRAVHKRVRVLKIWLERIFLLGLSKREIEGQRKKMRLGKGVPGRTRQMFIFAEAGEPRENWAEALLRRGTQEL